MFALRLGLVKRATWAARHSAPDLNELKTNELSVVIGSINTSNYSLEFLQQSSYFIFTIIAVVEHGLSQTTKQVACGVVIQTPDLIKACLDE